MNSNRKKLQKLIVTSNLKKQDQRNLLALFSQTKDKELQSVIDLFKKDPKYICIINNVYNVKASALKSRDKKAWREILQHEYESLKGLE